MARWWVVARIGGPLVVVMDGADSCASGISAMVVCELELCVGVWGCGWVCHVVHDGVWMVCAAEWILVCVWFVLGDPEGGRGHVWQWWRWHIYVAMAVAVAVSTTVNREVKMMEVASRGGGGGGGGGGGSGGGGGVLRFSRFVAAGCV